MTTKQFGACESGVNYPVVTKFLKLNPFCLQIRLIGFRTPTSLMAFMTRRWKVLLVLNVIAVGGFITFWGKCNTRTTKGIGLEALADVRRHTRLNITGQDTSVTHEILLRRLGSLEDVVYRQLNGMSGQQTRQSSLCY